MNNYKSLFLLDPSITFLNHGSFGATPKPVFAAYQNWQRRLEEQPVLFLGRSYHFLVQEAREILAVFVGTLANNLIFVPNATHAVNQIARSLKLEPGDEILTTDHEYGACDFTWEFVCQKNAAVYKHQPVTFPCKSDQEIADHFWKGVTGRTKAIYLSHITSPTALRLPVELICARARQAGILTVIDGAHTPGQIPLNLDTLNADFYTGNCHKWMLAPKGAAFLFANPRVQNLLEPLVVSWGYKNTPEFSSGSAFIDRLTWTGTHDPAAYLSIPAAIHFLNENNWSAVREDCHNLLVKYLPIFHEITGKRLLYHDSEQFIQMAAIEIPLLKDILAFKSILYDQEKIEVPLIEWNQRHFIRISVQAYNTENDLEKLLAALKRLIPEHKL